MTDFNRSFSDEILRGDFPFLTLLGIQEIDIGPGTAKLTLTARDEHLRSLGILHGGVTASLLDTVLGMAGSTHAPEGCHTVTMQLNINYTRAGRGGDELIATAETVHAGKQTAVCRGEVRRGDGALIATATSTVMFLPLNE